MKITGMRCVQVEIPLEKPIRTAIHDVRSVGCVLVYLDSDEDLSGEAYNFTMNAVRLDVLQAMIESFAPHVVGKDPHDVEGIWDAMWRDINFFGQKGVSIFAMSSIDTACWDLVGKAAGQPTCPPVRVQFGADREPREDAACESRSQAIDPSRNGVGFDQRHRGPGRDCGQGGRHRGVAPDRLSLQALNATFEAFY